jgi:hypothetical protein
MRMSGGPPSHEPPRTRAACIIFERNARMTTVVVCFFVKEYLVHGEMNRAAFAFRVCCSKDSSNFQSRSPFLTVHFD